VAAVLRYRAELPDVLLMKRARREGDRWSGHVSFPGGRREEGDADLRHTAMRETLEEVGLDLSGAETLGRLDDTAAVAKGKVLPMAITPWVFAVEDSPELRLGDEAESAFWLPLGEVISGRLDGTRAYRMGPVPLKLACWNYQGYEVWGLTHKMLSRLLDLIRSP
jgi:8-oxo-dGTP pyrophosphatase MutT (NUDIX family)